MFKEVLQIVPSIDTGALTKMERSLSSRFQKVAKGFGNGLLTAVKGGGWVGVTLSLIDKFLNPLKETREAIEKSISGANNITTNATQFNSTPGELFKLQKLAQAKGLDAEGLNTLLVKFQGAVAEAVRDPTKDTSVRNFTKDKDTVSSFFEFIQSLNKMDRNKQVTVQQEVFGEKQTLKMAEFLRADFAEIVKQTGLKSAAEYNPGIDKLSNLSDLSQVLKVSREVKDQESKAKLITEGMIRSMESADAVEAQKEKERIANFNNLQAISTTNEKIMNLVEKGVLQLGELITKLIPMGERLVGTIDRIKKSPLMRLIPGSTRGNEGW